ncbi:MAG: FAD-dependent oxidoreductase [Anaerolineae bacterium]|nr:FAD-dependent oxidoreductase [Anaerolineae bacterium]
MVSFNLPLGGKDASDQNRDYDVIIIGGGPAGASAAIYTARAKYRTLVIDKGLTAGALGLTHKIANYPGVAGEVSGAQLLQTMRDQARAFGAEFVQDKVLSVDLRSDPKVIFAGEGTYTARAVVLATGSMGRAKGVKGEEEFLGRGVSYCATCDAAFFQGKDVVVAGNNDEAVEEALHLAKFARRVILLVQTPDLKVSEELLREVEATPAIEVRYATRLREIMGDRVVHSVRIAPREGGEEILPVAGAFVYLQGSKPITDYLQGELQSTETGCLVVDQHYQTSVPGVFAVGDLLCNHIKQAVVAAADGVIAAMAIDRLLSGRGALRPDWS